jgi:outer membrane receptor protein involved in Fe transport
VTAIAARGAIAQTGTLVGRVTNAATGAPISSAQITVSDTRLGTPADAEGKFRIDNVPIIAHEVRVRAIGYKQTATAFSLAADGTTTIALVMTATPLELDAIVATSFGGDMRRRAVGNSVTTLNANEVVARSAVANLAEILQAKTPGLSLLQPSGTVGTAPSFRLRGAGSLYAGNNPTIYVDGVRVSARDQGNYDLAGQSTTALDAINPADLESIEIIKGPAASTLYGGEAAAGVIQIFTTKGRSGRITWDSRVETGRSDWPESLRPLNYALATAERLADTLTWPGFKGKSLGDVIAVRPMTDGEALRTASLSKVFLSVSGGADRYNFFASAGKSDEQGVFFNNFSNLRSLRGNFVFVPANTFTVSTNVALSHTHVRLPLNDGIGQGLIGSAYRAVPGLRYAYPGAQNYSTLTPEIANTYDNQTRADRYTIGASADYTPVSWFRNSLHVGLDANVGQAELYFPPNPQSKFVPRVSFFLDNTKGVLAQGRPLNQDVTLNYDGTLSHRWSALLVTNTSIGMQYLANVFRRTDAYGMDFGSAGMRSISSAAVKTSGDSLTEQKSIGVYAQQQLSVADRFFITLASRIDNNSAFGSKLRRVVYPKASVSYVISDEARVRVPGVSALRLRAAWGQAGTAPGPYDADRSYTSIGATTVTGTSSGRRYGSYGNADLRPERGSEIEAGFESLFFSARAGLDVSYYDKTTRDALIKVPVPPSTGFTGDLLTNLGTVSNKGLEIVLTTTPIQRASVAVDAALSLSTNANRLVSFGDERPPIMIGLYNVRSQRFQEGYPLGAMWAQRLRYKADGTLLKVDGIPQVDSVDVYMGPSVPTREISLSGGVLLFRRLRVHGLADYKAGHYQFNVKDWTRDALGLSWETVNPAADPQDVQLRTSKLQTLLHTQRADFVKLRDVSVSYDIPPHLLHRISERATLTVAGHNLRIWTKYGGADPEVNSSGAFRFNRDDSWTQPDTRRYSAALALRF